MASQQNSVSGGPSGPGEVINIEAGVEQQLSTGKDTPPDITAGGPPDLPMEAGEDIEIPVDAGTPPGDPGSHAPAIPADPVPATPAPSMTESMMPGDAGAGRDPGPVTDALQRLADSLPAWSLMALVVAAAVIVGLVFGMRMGRPHRRSQADRGAGPIVRRRALPAPESPVFIRYQEFLERKGVTAKEFDSKVREFTDCYRDMRQNLRDLMPGDPSLGGAAEEIREALDAGDFDLAFTLLSDVGTRENADGLEKHTAAQKHLMAAATAKMVAGDLQMARLECADAARLYRDAIAALPDFQEDLHGEFLNKYGTASYQSGEHETAIAAFEQALKILERKRGKNHPDVATALNNLALLHYSRGRYDAAEPLYQRALSIDESTLGADHPGVATDLNNLALLYKKMGSLDAAEPLLRRAMEIKEKQFDPGHPSLITGYKNYASLIRSLGRTEEADVFERKATVLPPKRTASPGR